MKLITRADDYGINYSTNIGIIEILKNTESIKNVSVMAVGPAVESGAKALKKYRNIDVGLHGTINSEWDYIKWLPISNRKHISSLISENNTFYKHPFEFMDQEILIEHIINEFSAQLDLLTKLGLDIKYFDTHMLPELTIEGLNEELERWTSEKGLLNQMDYYVFGPQPFLNVEAKLSDNISLLKGWLQGYKEDQGIYIAHPAKLSREMLLFSNFKFKNNEVANERNAEYEMLLSEGFLSTLEDCGVQAIRYSEADKNGGGFKSVKQTFSKM